jgi:uncharacterized protein (TIGR01777 family)
MATILIAGGTGLLGTRLSILLHDQGHEVLHLSRHADPSAPFPALAWDPSKGHIDQAAIERADAVVNLAGTGIADARWTQARKKLIIDSRVDGALLLKKAFEQTGKRPIYVAASAVGFYGDRGDQWLTETDAPGKGFLADSCVAWEAASQQLADCTKRLAIMRIGVVLSTQGGALAQYLPPLQKLRTASYFAKGTQYVPWVHIDDMCRMLAFALSNARLCGVYNAVSPNPVTSRAFADTLAAAYGAKAFVLPAPAFALRLAMGEMADVVLQGARPSAKKITEAGFAFQYPKLEGALHDLFLNIK